MDVATVETRESIHVAKQMWVLESDWESDHALWAANKSRADDPLAQSSSMEAYEATIKTTQKPFLKSTIVASTHS